MVIRGTSRVLRCSLAGVLCLLFASPAAHALSTTTWGDAGGGQGEFVFGAFPGIAADRSGDVWVTDQGNNRVEEFTGEGTFIRALGCSSDASTPCAPSSDDGQFDYPSGVAADLTRTEIYVSDRFNDRVEVFSSSTGAFLRSFPATGPIGIAVDRSGHVLADTGGGVIMRYNRDGSGGTVVTQAASPGDVASELAASDKGDIFTTFFDQQTGTRDIVQKFTALGVNAASSPQIPSVVFYGPSFSPGGPTQGQVTDANYGYPQEGEALYSFSSSLRSPSTVSPVVAGLALSRPEATAYDCAGNLYVVDGDNGRIVKLIYGTGSATCPGATGISKLANQAVGSLVSEAPASATVRISCPLQICRGTLHLVVSGQALGTSSFTVPGDSARLLSIRLDARGRALLRAGRRFPLTIVTSSRGKTVRRFTVLRAPTSVLARCPSSIAAGTPVSIAGSVHRTSGVALPRESVVFDYGTLDVPYTGTVVRTRANGAYTASFTPTAPGRWTLHVSSLGDRNDAPAQARPCSFTVTPAPAITLGPGFHPSVVVDPAGTAHAVWAHQNADGTEGLSYCRIPLGGSGCQGMTELPALPGTFSAPFLLRRADGALIVIDSRSTGTTYAIISSDGGNTWQTPVAVGGGFGEDDVRLTPDGQSADRIYGTTGSNSFQRTPLSGPQEASSINLDAGAGGSDPGYWYFGQIAYLPDGRPMVVFGDLNKLAYRIYAGGSLYDQGSWDPLPPAVIGEGGYASLAGGPGGVFLLSLSSDSPARIELRGYSTAAGFSAPARLSLATDTSVVEPALTEDPGGGLTALWVSSGQSLVYRHADGGSSFGLPQTVYTAPSGAGVYDPRVAANDSGARWAVWDDNSSTGQAHALRLP